MRLEFKLVLVTFLGFGFMVFTFFCLSDERFTVVQKNVQIRTGRTGSNDFERIWKDQDENEDYDDDDDNSDDDDNDDGDDDDDDDNDNDNRNENDNRGSKSLNENNHEEVKLFESVLYNRYQNIENISCIPYYLGHKPGDDLKLFRQTLGKKTCETFAEGDYRIVEEKLIASCPNKQTPIFYLGETREAERFGKFDINFTELQTSEIILNFSSREYLAFHCRNRGKGRMILKNSFDPNVVKNAEKIQNSLKNSENINNLTVILLVVDSTSRQSFFRNLPKVTNFLSEKFKKPDKNFVIYDFLFNHAIESKTLPNLIPILTGQSKKSLENILSNYSINNSSHSEFFKSIEEKTLWSYFKQRGFVTHFSYDTVSDYLSTIIGRSISSDHILSNFWHLSQKVFQYTDFNEKLQCIGDRYPHDYSFSYMRDFIENYKFSNKFIYSHLSVAHEGSGTRLSTMDNSFLSFIIWILDKFKDNNLAFFFISDHGRPGGSPVLAESRAEVVLPFNFMLASQSVIKNLKAHKNLKENTKKMTSRFDLFKTIKFLAHFPYENYSQLRKTSKKITTEIDALNLFFEDIPSSRTCKDVGVPIEFCFCSNWKIIDPKDWKDDETLRFLIEKSFEFQNQNQFLLENCPFMKLSKILNIKYFSFNEMDEFEPVFYEIKVLTDFDTVFTIRGSRASAEKYGNLNKGHYLNLYHRFSFMSKDGRDTFVMARIWEIIGVDFCENFKYRKLFTSQIELKGTCAQTCRNIGRACETPDFSEEFFNTLKSFGQVYDTGKRSVIQKHSNLVFITSGDHCNSVFSNIINICNCVEVTTQISKE